MPVPEPRARPEIDRAADAAYVRLSDAAVARTERFNGSVLVDVDTAGHAVGIEILSLSAAGDVDVDALADRFGLPDSVRDELRTVLGRISPMPAVTTITLAAPAPAATRIVDAIAAAGGVAPAWRLAENADGLAGTASVIEVGTMIVRVFELPGPPALPAVLSIAVPDPDAAAVRLQASGFTPVPGGDSVTVPVTEGFTLRVIGRESH